MPMCECVGQIKSTVESSCLPSRLVSELSRLIVPLLCHQPTPRGEDDSAGMHDCSVHKSQTEYLRWRACNVRVLEQRVAENGAALTCTGVCYGACSQPNLTRDQTRQSSFDERGASSTSSP